MRPEALVELTRAVDSYGPVEYFAIYEPPESANPTLQGQAIEADPAPPSVGWVPFTSTTSTFAARVAALKPDAPLLRLLTWTGGAWDHTSCLVLQGHTPFSLGKYLFTQLTLQRLRRLDAVSALWP